MTLLKDYKHIILYGVVLAILVFILKWIQWKILIAENSIEIYIGLIAILFTVLGAWVATQLTQPKMNKVFVEKKVLVTPIVEEVFTIDEIELNKLNLTKREYEILQLVTEGNSNSEIASNLFLSLSTVKTHVSNLYSKMNVKSRGQAIVKAKRLKITE